MAVGRCQSQTGNRDLAEPGVHSGVGDVFTDEITHMFTRGVKMNRLLQTGMVGVLMLGLAGCASTRDPGQRAVGGALIGAGSGAALGAIAGGPAGAVLGAGVGAVAGAATGYATTPPPPPRQAPYYPPPPPSGY
jgi:hypothetical protein